MSAVIDLTKIELTKSEVLYGISWNSYESLVEKYWNMPSPRLTYDSGILEVEMPLSRNHEEDVYQLNVLVGAIAEELELDLRNFGSATHHKKGIRKGFEPDSCFYIQTLSKIENYKDLNDENFPPPDLIIEVNRTSSSVPRMPIFAAFGVREIWRLNNDEVKFYELVEGVYLETENSIALPILTGQKATEFLLESRKSKSTAWVKKIRNWVNEELIKK